MVTINGEQMDNVAGVTVLSLLEEQNSHHENVVVELNGQILSKAVLAETVLVENDKVEIIAFVGGG
ncbi:sulfur carrier protein ThiS [Fructobacillus tropaeoli]|uniref:Thiamine biosynthesis protein ThiS n=1 Tax=Fructobacillus tropaeoli TaxID=709323 RepID=A0A3F3H146_9LACO|nr:sulfur carrier protein ThiS [Fructobacillus tropaeoli]GAP04276.1 thiamine biosynthesis protein ThiS [Fructobacillus tropaeoli]CAK1247847.1 Sulfur carrier protein ThiS (thiamine biosynthesis) (ThiS) [Fructobacillus tropaeoli]